MLSASACTALPGRRTNNPLSRTLPGPDSYVGAYFLPAPFYIIFLHPPLITLWLDNGGENQNDYDNQNVHSGQQLSPSSPGSAVIHRLLRAGYNPQNPSSTKRLPSDQQTRCGRRSPSNLSCSRRRVKKMSLLIFFQDDALLQKAESFLHSVYKFNSISPPLFLLISSLINPKSLVSRHKTAFGSPMLHLVPFVQILPTNKASPPVLHFLVISHSPSRSSDFSAENNH